MVFRSVKVLIATIVLRLGSAAIAEDLVYYATDATGTTYHIDADSIRRHDYLYVDVWIKLDASKDKTVSYRTARDKLRINCSDETFGLLSINHYRPDGTVTDSRDYKNPEMSSIIPGTAVKELFKILCPSSSMLP